MDLLRLIRDWGLGALVFLGLAAQPASFLPPIATVSGVSFRLRDAFPDNLELLIRYGTPITIEYHYRIHDRSGRFREGAIEKRLVYDLKTRSALCTQPGSLQEQRPLEQAKAWIASLDLSVGDEIRQINVRAILNVEGRSSNEAQGLWGGTPTAVWRAEIP